MTENLAANREVTNSDFL